MKALAVFGGTFNPFHIGHRQMLDAICCLDFIDKVLVMPSNIPPHKAVDILASDNDRLSMCRLAVKGLQKAEVSDIELKRAGKSYTVDTLRELRLIYPDYKLYLSIGGDMLTSFTEWREYKKILKTAGLLVFSRATTEYEEFDAAVGRLQNEGAEIFLMTQDIINISSTEVRNSLADKVYLSEFLPKEILDYIINNNVYGD